jgi:hypothetical protein
MTRASSIPLTLNLHVHRIRLEVEITNPGPEAVRIWDRHNSWGWETLVLDVASAIRPEEIFRLTAKPRIWTRNGPGFIEIPPGGSHLVLINPGFPEWEGVERLEPLRTEVMRLQATLRIPPSPEAETYAVIVGEVKSPWQPAEPPHLWLFNAA